ncbi:MAG: Hypoxanthine phosphoribosyltransferase [Firmicutes bacterium]|nr:Hypoxanthine phosphoribosyltransferase [Bacillota bacterium]MBT9157887.1 Hypoxanthine phosphoribosyltransferase [Bacillota bacterium]
MEEPLSLRVLIPREEIAARVAAMGRQISADYAGKELLLVVVLRGAAVFAADLCRHLTTQTVLDFISVSSYGSATSTSGVVRFLKDLEESVEGRHVLIVEDIVDTGLTLNYLLENLRTRKPASLVSCTLLDKPSRRRVDIQPDYLGFTIDDLFVVGYGLDFDQYYRNLPDICVQR